MAHEKSYAVLTGGIHELDFRGQPVASSLVLGGDHAFPLAMNPRGQVVMAASSFGLGRMVVLGHEAYLTAFPDMVKNALTWLTSPGNPTICIHEACSPIAGSLSSAGFQVAVGEFHTGVGLYITDAYSVDGASKGLVTFLKGGGSLLVAGQARDWAQKHPRQNVFRDFPGNKVCGVAGIYFSEQQGEPAMFSIPNGVPSNWQSLLVAKDFKEDLEFLLEGVSEFDIRGGALASEVLVHGPLAFPIATADDDKAFFAGAYYGSGRVIVGTHESYLGRGELSRFLANAVRWLDQGRMGHVGVVPSLNAAQSLLSQSGLQCEKTDFREDLSVYVCSSYSSDNCSRIQDFVAEGGGLLIGGHGWYWAQSHGQHKVLKDYPGNRILNTMGLSILAGTVKSGLYNAPQPAEVSSKAYHFRHMLHSFAGHMNCGQPLQQHENQCLKRLGHDCATFLQMKAHNCPSYTSILSLLTDVVKQGRVPQVGKKNPIVDAKDHLLLSVGSQLYRVSPKQDELLPYIIQKNRSLPLVANNRVIIDGNTNDVMEWKSTGLYLYPGLRTYISVPSQIVGKGWKIQVGCHTDNIGSANELKRAPVVHEQFSIKSEMMLVSNLWGGLLYLVAPPNSTVGNLQIVVQWAVRAPYYKSGKTTVQQWVGHLRNAPAPWAELEFENIILTVKSKEVRGLDRPDELASLWDDIMRGVAELAAVPTKFPRKERIVADVQISAGFMHSGYPIMIHLMSAANLLIAKSARESGMWGAIHELGHNQQRGAWEFPPNTTECTCNLWSLYVHDTVLCMPRPKAHEAVSPEQRKERLECYVREGRQLDKWEVFTALETYMQLQEEFGWDAYKKVFSAYHDMKGVPNDKYEKMNLYAETFSKTVNRNLAPFFKAWGWPITPSLEQKLAALPAWSNHPMAQYA